MASQGPGEVREGFRMWPVELSHTYCRGEPLPQRWGPGDGRGVTFRTQSLGPLADHTGGRPGQGLCGGGETTPPSC